MVGFSSAATLAARGFKCSIKRLIVPPLPASSRPSGARLVQKPKTKVISTKQVVGGKDFQELLQHLYDGAFVTDTQGKIISANIRAQSFFQHPTEVLCGKNIGTFVMGADEELLTTIQHNLKHKQFTLIQAFCERADQTVFPAEISVNSGYCFISRRQPLSSVRCQ